MRKLKNISNIIAACTLLLLCATGCDFFRSIAGRPTSAEIQIKRQMIQRAEMEHQAMLDSVKKVEKQIADSLAIVDSLERMKVYVINPSTLGGLYSQQVSKRYYIIVGSFMNKDNAERHAASMRNKGHEAEIIRFRNGYNAVGICGSESRVAVSDTMARLLSKREIDSSAWIMENH